MLRLNKEMSGTIAIVANDRTVVIIVVKTEKEHQRIILSELRWAACTIGTHSIPRKALCCSCRINYSFIRPVYYTLRVSSIA
jgi:hypothetical protein